MGLFDAPAGWVSSFPPPPAPAVPALPRHCWRPLPHLGPEGWTWAEPPTHTDFIRHAEKYGTELIAFTAAETFDEEALTVLIMAIDRIDDVQGKKDSRYYKPPRRKAADVRARALLGIEEEEGS